jgi:ubiquitin carboxyl-terminal hydrolase 36/42
VCAGEKYESSTYEDFLDLSLEIMRASSVTRALQHFTSGEVLDGPNKYRCPTNNKLVRACVRCACSTAGHGLDTGIAGTLSKLCLANPA